MAGTLTPSPRLQFFTSAGIPASGHRLFWYLAGTSTSEPVFQDIALSVSYSQPITLDSAGRTSAGVYLASKSYKLVFAPPGIDDPPLSPIWTQDNIVATFLFGGGIYTPAAGGAMIVYAGTASTAISATNEGLRTSTWEFFDTRTDQIDNAVIEIDTIQRTNPGSGVIKRTGIHVKSYTQPDNGGDTSAIMGVQTGGGNAGTFTKSALLRPAGYTNYESSPQGALEVLTSDQSQAIIAVSGIQAFGATANASNAIVARVDNAASKGILISPSDGVFNTRAAFTIGAQALNAADNTIQAAFLMNGDLRIGKETASTYRIHAVKASADCTIAAERTTTGPSSVVMSAQSGNGIVGTVDNTPLQLVQNNVERMRFDTSGRAIFKEAVILQDGALATNATDGFTYIPSSAGIPTGAPVAQTGTIPFQADSTNNNLNYYSGSAWRTLGPSLLFSSYTNIGNVGGGEDPLHTYSMPGGTLGVDGYGVRCTAWGTFAATGNGKTVIGYVGSTAVVSSTSLTTSGGFWRLTFDALRTGAATQRASGEYKHTDGAGASVSKIGTATPGETLSGTVTLKITGTSAGSATDDIVQQAFIVERLVG